ncbi:MFS transporter [Campylobacter coli]|uniref:MFS transporter n=1 Tax=Campylobacter coli TaxID=195 RepID=UPI000763D825|nr:MFS transporter [Campylobacter coli]EAL6090397.1 MFS transporter [Campylobacter coli]ECR2443090.1 multidrug efflux MFS transporter [Campylobacter coli]MCH3744737.1 MFS transporter [Campylobacter coli]MCH3753111.1 MFS transporter [Campylobacter coli]MDC8033152.1 MFS transporter [Campylobacter coli]
MENFNRTLLVCWFGVFTTSMGLSQIAPILPLYIKELGHTNTSEIAFYSGLAFGITPLGMAIFSPLWAFLGAKYGYKNMLLRASFGMSVLTLWLSFAHSALEVVFVRGLTGIISGFTSAAVVFIAVIAPKEKVAYALGTLSTASISGSLLGPLFGGFVAEFFSISTVFDMVAFLIACSFVTIYFFIYERKIQKEAKKNTQKVKENKTLIIVLFITTFVIQFGTFGVMPILSIYVEQIHQGGNLALWAGIVVAASGISNLFFAPKLGKIADKIGPSKIIFTALIFCGICFYLQAVVSNVYTLIFVRLLIGVGLGGLLPCVNALLKKGVSAKNLSLVFGFNQACQFLGNFCGAFGGGLITAHFSVELVFAFICCIFILNAIIFLIFERNYIFSNQGL